MSVSDLLSIFLSLFSSFSELLSLWLVFKYSFDWINNLSIRGGGLNALLLIADYATGRRGYIRPLRTIIDGLYDP